MMASHPLVLGIDQSTQGTKALLLDEQGHLIAKCSRPHQQIINEKGYIEHDLNEIYTNVCGVVADLTFCGAEVLRLLGGGMNAHRTPAVIDQMSMPTCVFCHVMSA